MNRDGNKKFRAPKPKKRKAGDDVSCHEMEGFVFCMNVTKKRLGRGRRRGRRCIRISG